MPSPHAPIYTLDISKLAGVPGFSDLIGAGASPISFGTEEEFKRTCAGFCAKWQHHNSASDDSEFQAQKDKIPQGGSNIIITAWGGVVITEHSHPHVEKYLVVNSDCFLAFEKHELKEETLSVREGAGILLHHRAGQASVDVVPLVPGVSRHLSPSEEHCIIALDNLLVFEVSEDYKGMDKDLIFIFMGS
jgi:hypothetical protein